MPTWAKRPMETKQFVCEENGVRLDAFVSSACDVSRSLAADIIDQNLVLVNGKVAKKSAKLKLNDKIEVQMPDLAEPEAIPQDIPLDIVYEDDDLLVVNKPKGMVVHPAPGNPDGTLVNALLHHCKGSLSGINGVLRPGIVHRIDKDTSGLLVVAKTDEAHNGLTAQWHEKKPMRRYVALVNGNIKDDNIKSNIIELKKEISK